MGKLNHLCGALCCSVMAAAPCAVHAQKLPDLPVPTPGTTINMSLSSGSKASLTFGSSTTFGTSASFSATDGASASSTSTLTPSFGSVKFSIGDGVAAGRTSADISNLRASGSSDTEALGSKISETNNNATGNAILTGVTGVLELTLDPSKSSFGARTNSLHETYGAKDGLPGADGKSLSSNTTQISNASASAVINTNTNVDINTTSFTQTFSQAF
jgi:hypothetical protein